MTERLSTKLLGVDASDGDDTDNSEDDVALAPNGGSGTPKELV